MIYVTTTVVAYGGPNVFRNGIQIPQQFFCALGLEVGILLEGGIEILDVSAMVHVVMQLHGLLIDMGFECSVVIRQRR